jgi:hypothetical protein
MTTYRIMTTPIYAAGKWHQKYSVYRKWLCFWFYEGNCGFLDTPEEAELALKEKLEKGRCPLKRTVVKTVEMP